MAVKTRTMQEAIAAHIHDGSVIAIEGFTASICFAAAHEIIRQRRKDLTLCRMTPDLIYDQMIAAGCAKKLVFSYLGNPGVGSLHCIRRAVEQAFPRPLEVEEYTHFGMLGRYLAGASRLPFFPLRSFQGSDLPAVNRRIRFVEDPFGSGRIAVVPPLNPEVTILHAQRADAQGNTQMWGLLGAAKEAALAAQVVIVVVEEIVDEAVIRADPNRTLLPGETVHAVVHEPGGAHPSYVQGYWDRDNDFYRQWDRLSRDPDAVQAWLDEWVYGVDDRTGYVEKFGEEVWARLKPQPAFSGSVNYGAYR